MVRFGEAVIMGSTPASTVIAVTVPGVSDEIVITIAGRDCRASVWLQDAMHLSQRSWPVGEKL